MPKPLPPEPDKPYTMGRLMFTVLMLALVAAALIAVLTACGPIKPAAPAPSSTQTPTSATVPAPPAGAPLPVPTLGTEGFQGLVIQINVTRNGKPLTGQAFTVDYRAAIAPGEPPVTIGRQGEPGIPFAFTRERVTRLEVDPKHPDVPGYGVIYERISWPPTLTPCLLTFTVRGSGVPAGAEVTLEVTDGVTPGWIPVAGNEYDKAKLGQIYLQISLPIPYVR